MQTEKISEIPPALSVAELSSKLKRTIEGEFNGIRVQGEISSLKRHSSGHIYFTLKDEDAIINGICWRGVAAKSQFQLEDGLEVIITGRVTIYEKRSNYQIIVDKFDPTGQGALLKLLEERKQRLAAAGLFDAERKQILPRLPQVIGVVTSPTGAVIRDILHRISDRFPCRIIVSPVAVQGDGAAKQIAAAIRGFSNLPEQIPKPDVLIVARGGGSLEDLWCFNEEEVVHAVAECQIPVISAVGHETDTTLIDYVADKRAPTPTAAAEIAVPVLGDLWQWVQDRSLRMSDITSKLILQHQTYLAGLVRGLPAPNRLIEYKVQRLDEWVERLHAGIKLSDWTYSRRLEQASISLKAPTAKINEGTAVLQGLKHRLNNAMINGLNQSQQQLGLIKVRLEQSSYQATLKRGFALATQNGHIVRQACGVDKTKELQVQFVDSSIALIAAEAVTTTKPKQKSKRAKLKAKVEGQGTLF